MKQVIVIHGGTTFADYDEYLQYLETKPVSIDRLTYKPLWKELLQENLGSDYLVLLPSMPNKTNARYREWETWFTHLTTLMTDDCILIGHSMGAIFLAKYLSMHTFPRRIAATILVATPYDDESVEDLTDFRLDGITDLFRSQAGKVITYNGLDDPVISADDTAKYTADLPEAEHIVMSAPDHFMRVDFPELTAKILNEIG